MSILDAPVSNKKFDPVTVPAAPQKVIVVCMGEKRGTQNPLKGDAVSGLGSVSWYIQVGALCVDQGPQQR